MIIFGTRTKPVQAEKLLTVSCTQCNNHEVSRFTTWSYFHIYWIPTVAYKKSLGTVCAHCQHSLHGKDVPDMYRSAVGTQPEKLGSVATMFSGLVLIIGLIIAGGMHAESQKKQYLAWAGKPQANDLYLMNANGVKRLGLDNIRYAVFKVARVDGEKVALQLPTVGYEKLKGASRALSRNEPHGKGYFSSEEVELAAGEIQKLTEQGTIQRIVRQ